MVCCPKSSARSSENPVWITSEGLLTSERPQGKRASFTYDGRLVRDEDPAGGYTELARTVCLTAMAI